MRDCTGACPCAFPERSRAKRRRPVANPFQRGRIRYVRRIEKQIMGSLNYAHTVGAAEGILGGLGKGGKVKPSVVVVFVDDAKAVRVPTGG
jgi:hypothetical protein